MTFSNIDTIVRRWLLDRGYPIHYYLEALLHASSCIRDLTKDTLQVIKTVQLAVDNTGSAELPEDYMDDICLGLEVGGKISKIPHASNVSPIRMHNGTTGAFEATSTQDVSSFYSYPYFQSTAYTWFWKIDSWGEFTGGFFGARGATSSGYEIFREQRRVQVGQNFAGGAVVLQYISDGQSIDNAVQIDSRAINCILSYIDWQRSRNAANIYSPEGKTFFNSKRLLKAQLNPLTVTDITNIIRSSYTASIKN